MVRNIFSTLLQGETEQLKEHFEKNHMDLDDLDLIAQFSHYLEDIKTWTKGVRIAPPQNMGIDRAFVCNTNSRQACRGSGRLSI